MSAFHNEKRTSPTSLLQDPSQLHGAVFVFNVLITGAAGFIGSALCGRLASGNKVVGVDIASPTDGALNIALDQAELTDEDSVAAVCEKHSPDVVIHCAGIAHQKIGAVDSAAYMRVNSEVTEKFAEAAAKFNPDVCFVFLSSVSVYGEGKKGDRKDGEREDGRQETGDGTTEEGDCWPSSDYAVSKLDAERRLTALYDEGKLQNLVILRLAPVYDREWNLNLDRRVFAPWKVAYLRFGKGMQKMSALARPNLVDFIAHLIDEILLPQYDLPDLRSRQTHTDKHRYMGRKKDDKRCLAQRRKGAKREKLTTDTHRHTGCEKDEERQNLKIYNVCDAEAYEFNRIIEVFRKSGIRPRRPVISVPLSVVWVATRIAGCLLRNKREWVYSCYDKLVYDLVFDNKGMLETGFRPRHSLETIMGKRRTEKGDRRYSF